MTVKLDAIQVLALSCFGLVLGGWLKRRFRLLDELEHSGPDRRRVTVRARDAGVAWHG